MIRVWPENIRKRFECSNPMVASFDQFVRVDVLRARSDSLIKYQRAVRQENHVPNGPLPAIAARHGGNKLRVCQKIIRGSRILEEVSRGLHDR